MTDEVIPIYSDYATKTCTFQVSCIWAVDILLVQSDLCIDVFIL